jgi:hypothetical protein
MSAALTVQPRHLAIPESCLFSPAALSIPAAISKEEFQKLGAALVALDTADGLWTCDLAHFAITRWGKEEGAEIARVATGYRACTVLKLAYIAERFTPEHRPDGFTRAHFKALLPFPQDWLNTWLPTVASRRLSAAGIRALAVEQFGSDPSQRPMRKMRAVSIPAALFARLAEVSPTQKVSTLAEAIFIEWLSKSPEEQQFSIAVAAEQKREQKNERQRQRNAKRAEREARKAALRDKRDAEKLAQKAERQAFYEAERVKRDAEKAAERDKREAEKAALKAEQRDKRDAEKLAQKAEREAFYEAERVKREAEKTAAVAAKAKKKAVAHCAKIAQYTERQGKPSQWLTKAEADEVIKSAPHLESYACDCGQFHIRRAVGACPSDGKLSDDTSPSSQTSAA